MYTLFVILHVLVSLFLILVVLLQSGKGASMGAAFGGASSTIFGSRGQTTFIQKLTAVCAIVFMIMSVTLAALSTSNQSALEERAPHKAKKEAGMSGKPAAAEKQPAAEAPAAPDKAPAAPTAQAPAAAAPQPAVPAEKK